MKKPDDFFAKLCCSPSQSGFRMIKIKKKHRRPAPRAFRMKEATAMTEEKKTLGELLFDPRIGKIAPDAIRNRDLSREES